MKIEEVTNSIGLVGYNLVAETEDEKILLHYITCNLFFNIGEEVMQADEFENADGRKDRIKRLKFLKKKFYHHNEEIKKELRHDHVTKLVEFNPTHRCKLCFSSELNRNNYCERCETIVPIEPKPVYRCPHPDCHSTDVVMRGSDNPNSPGTSFEPSADEDDAVNSYCNTCKRHVELELVPSRVST